MSLDTIKSLLEELRRMGVNVRFGPSVTDAEIAEAESHLGFQLPESYRAFLRAFGRIELELVRTWFFYGVGDGIEKAREYADRFEPFRNDTSGAYYPSRFVVLMDEGEYSNSASGWVYDADLKALLHTDGGRYVSRDEAFEGSFMEKLIDELKAVRDRVADPTDELVSGADDEVNARRKLPG